MAGGPAHDPAGMAGHAPRRAMGERVDGLPGHTMAHVGDARFYRGPDSRLFVTVHTLLGALAGRLRYDAARRTFVSRRRGPDARRAAVGNAAHRMAACRALGRSDAPLDGEPAEAGEIARLLARALDESAGRALAAERNLVSARLGIGGTVDLVAEWRGRLAVIEHKTRRSIGERPGGACGLWPARCKIPNLCPILRGRWWSRVRTIWRGGRRHRVAAKLTHGQKVWIARNPKNMSPGDVARLMGAGRRHVNRIKRQHADTGRVPDHGRPGRRRKRITRRMELIVLAAYAKHRCGAVRLEAILAAQEIHIPHNTIHAILERHGLTRRNRPGQRRSFVRHGRTFSNSMWHSDWKQPRDGRHLIAYEDDASRLIAGYGVFEHATSANAVSVLRRAIAGHGKPASIITDHGSQSCAVDAESRRRGATEFENFLVANDIRHVLARVRHPQTNGKTGRFFGILNQKIHLFVDIDEFMAWWNTVNPHMALNVDELETPCEAFERKMAPPGATTVTDEETGEEYAVSWEPPLGGSGEGRS